jgi:hypothetical protein
MMSPFERAEKAIGGDPRFLKQLWLEQLWIESNAPLRREQRHTHDGALRIDGGPFAQVQWRIGESQS